MKRINCIICLIIFSFLFSCTPHPTAAPQTDYAATLAEYRIYAEYAIRGEIETRFEDEVMSGAQPWNHWYGLMNWAGLFWWPLSYDAFGYAIEDLNKDGTPELILLLRDYSVFAIFTTVDGEPILLGDYYTRHRCAILDSGLLYTWSSSGEDEWEFALQQISPDSRELLYIVQYGSTTGGELEQHEQHYYKIIEGTEMIISEMELAAFLEQNPLFGDTTPKEITKKSGIVFIPLFDS